MSLASILSDLLCRKKYHPYCGGPFVHSDTWSAAFSHIAWLLSC